MRIGDTEYSAELPIILNELVSQMRANGVQYMQKMTETPTHVMVCCPYHNNGMERRPSMGIRKSDALAHCFVCSDHPVHSLPEVISHCFGRDDGGLFGWDWLNKNFNSTSIESRKEIPLNVDRPTRDNINRNDRTTKSFVTEEELDKYRYYHPYWSEKRHITDERLIELFDLGYDPETDCITMPNRDLNGNCVFVARRSVKTKYFNYPSGVEKPVYGLYEISKILKDREKILKPEYVNFTEIIICESMIDALTCLQYGKVAVALNGLGTDLQFDILRRFPCRKYILATDMDKAGLQGRERIRKALYNKVVTEYLWDLNIAKDINDMKKPYFMGLEEVF